MGFAFFFLPILLAIRFPAASVYVDTPKLFKYELMYSLACISKSLNATRSFPPFSFIPKVESFFKLLSRRTLFTLKFFCECAVLKNIKKNKIDL